MSAIEPIPGEILLCGLARLENRRSVPEKPYTQTYTCTYDAVFKCADGSPDGIGSFRHHVGADKTRKLDEVYEITAKACNADPPSPEHAQEQFTDILLQIVGFKPGRNINSKRYGDNQINLLGEIRKVRPIVLRITSRQR